MTDITKAINHSVTAHATMKAQAGNRFIVSIECDDSRMTSHYANYDEVLEAMERMTARSGKEAFWSCSTPEKLLATKTHA